ncbi:LacI family DNA-binding transcriptional regulator [Sebaldella termitidis]|uniref:LacI family DNA-binding transcriptional regulator n=1 Tax=Sebaldella termitidis TaxID=826 RepID=UPI003EBF8EA4
MTLEEIAKLCNVSTSTVSRVLNNKKGISEKTRKNILDLVKDLEKQEIPILKKTTKTIAFIVPSLSNYFFSTLLKKILIEVENKNIDILVFDINDDIEREIEVIKNLSNKNIDGMILISSSKNDEKFKIKKELLTFVHPFILMDRKLKDASFDGVYVDNIRGVFALTEYLIKKGKKDITIITGDKNSNISMERIEGYKEALYMNGIEISSGHIVFADFYDSRKIEKSLKSVITEKNYPKTLICCNNIILQIVIKLIMQNNLRINKDITVVSFDNTDFLDNLGFKISYVSPDLDTLVSQSINLILENILNKKNTTRQIDIIPELVEKN